MPECEADRRNKQALYVLENEWGQGRFDYAKIKGILAARDTEACTCEPEPERMSA